MAGFSRHAGEAPNINDDTSARGEGQRKSPDGHSCLLFPKPRRGGLRSSHVRQGVVGEGSHPPKIPFFFFQPSALAYERHSVAPSGLNRQEEGGVWRHPIPGAMPAGCYVRALQARPSWFLLLTLSLCHFATLPPRFSDTLGLRHLRENAPSIAKNRPSLAKFHEVSASFARFREVSASFGGRHGNNSAK